MLDKVNSYILRFDLRCTNKKHKTYFFCLLFISLKLKTCRFINHSQCRQIKTLKFLNCLVERTKCFGSTFLNKTDPKFEAFQCCKNKIPFYFRDRATLRIYLSIFVNSIKLTKNIVMDLWAPLIKFKLFSKS